MANTYVKIASVTVTGATAANMEFTSIPATYDDLVLKISTRGDTGSVTNVEIRPNNQTANRTARRLYGSGSGVASESITRNDAGFWNAPTYTANTFSSNEVYIPNYRGSTNKSFSADGVNENNATEAWQFLVANLWSDTSAITSITIIPTTGNWVQYTSATLYGIKKS